MLNEDEIECAQDIGEGRGRTVYLQLSAAQLTEDGLGGKLCRAGCGGVVISEGMKPMRIRGGEQRFTKLPGDEGGAAIRIEEPFVEVAILDRIEAIDLGDEASPDGRAENIEWMWGDGKQGIATKRAQSAKIGEGV